MKHYTEEQKQKIYLCWIEYQKQHNIPLSEYPYGAYTDTTYELWEKVLNKR
jgi:hypothetical protein